MKTAFMVIGSGAAGLSFALQAAAHETGRNLVCRLLLEKKKQSFPKNSLMFHTV